MYVIKPELKWGCIKPGIWLFELDANQNIECLYSTIADYMRLLKFSDYQLTIGPSHKKLIACSVTNCMVCIVKPFWHQWEKKVPGIEYGRL